MMDSLTRLCLAQREIGLAVGEPPATRGYPPSVFNMLPQLLERAGNSQDGTLTGVYTVLVEGDDMNEPVADAVRGILDGHIVLSRDLAIQGHFPAIDVLGSVSRVMPAVVGAGHLEQATAVRQVLATMRSAQDLLDIGAYQPGANPAIDHATAHIDAVHAFLRQTAGTGTSFDEAVAWLTGLFGQGGEAA
jgi:flagellum-specific ATP synthase